MKRLLRVGLGTAVILSALSLIESQGQGSADHVRWDLVNVLGGGTAAGGSASALANEGSKITLTGEGTFVAPAGGGGESSSATGGGDWQAFAPGGAPTGSGTYEITGLVRWEKAPGSLPLAFPDFIGDPAERSAGLAVLRIEYSDGDHGILVVSCHLGGTPDTVFEGITASKGFATYWERLAPAPGAEGNRTLFHVRQ